MMPILQPAAAAPNPAYPYDYWHDTAKTAASWRALITSCFAADHYTMLPADWATNDSYFERPDILWEACKPALERQCFREMDEAIGNGHEITTDHYTMLYTFVYTTCTQKPPHNWSEKLYNMLLRRARAAGEKYAVGTSEREVWIRFMAHVFKYLDRFYMKRLTLGNLKEVLEREMTNGVPLAKKIKLQQINHLLLKHGFRRWSTNEDLMAEAYDPEREGKAYKRQCLWWSQNGLL